MTKQLTAGRELDALVAEQVMGLNILRAETDMRGWSGTGWPAIVNIPAGDPYYHHELGDVMELPYYSTDIAAADEVAFKMLDSVHCERFLEEVTKGDVKDPANICRAALAAVGEG